MSDLPPSADQLLPGTVEKMKMTLRIDATVTVFDDLGNATDWLKPGSEASVTWRGVPSEQEVALRFKDLTTINSTTLEEVLTTIRTRLEKVRGKR